MDSTGLFGEYLEYWSKKEAPIGLEAGFEVILAGNSGVPGRQDIIYVLGVWLHTCGPILSSPS